MLADNLNEDLKGNRIEVSKRVSGRRWIVLSFVAIIWVASIVGIVLLCILPYHDPYAKNNYAIMIDGGSSKSEVNVFTWQPIEEGSPSNLLPNYVRFGSKKFGPGIAKFSTKMAELPAYVKELVQYAQANVPKSEWSKTPIYLRATAGMRLLALEQQTSILSEVKSQFSQSGFHYKDQYSSVITGEEEGIFGWVSANYAENIFSTTDQKKSTYGVMDLGGASAEMTMQVFNKNTLPANNSFTVVLADQSYSLYSQTFLGYGQNAFQIAFRQYLIDQSGGESVQVDDPCLMVGYNLSDTILMYNNIKYTMVGIGNYPQCISELRAYFVAHFNLVPLDLTGPFIGISSFYYLTNFLQINSTAPIPEIRTKTETLCNTSWSNFCQVYNCSDTTEASNYGRYCFLGNYVDVLLVDGFQFNSSKKDLRFVDYGWTPGAMAYEANNFTILNHSLPSYGTATNGGLAVLIISSMVCFLATLALILWVYTLFYPSFLVRILPCCYSSKLEHATIFYAFSDSGQNQAVPTLIIEHQQYLPNQKESAKDPPKDSSLS